MNIIFQAIATANAVIAAIVCLQAVKVLKNNIKKTREVSLRVQPTQHYILAASTFADRNENCVVCAEKPTVTITLDTKKVNLTMIETLVLLVSLVHAERFPRKSLPEKAVNARARC